jgi:hypothetical protein
VRAAEGLAFEDSLAGVESAAAAVPAPLPLRVPRRAMRARTKRRARHVRLHRRRGPRWLFRVARCTLHGSPDAVGVWAWIPVCVRPLAATLTGLRWSILTACGAGAGPGNGWDHDEPARGGARAGRGGAGGAGHGGQPAAGRAGVHVERGGVTSA